MKPTELLNQHLDTIVLNNKPYPAERVKSLYAKLTAPKASGTFYQSDRVKGEISPNGDVGFQTYYPETGWNYRSPDELQIATSTPKPLKEIGKMGLAFKQLVNSPEGTGLYTNTPISDHRADAYRKTGFVEADSIQVLDNRRFRNIPAVNELYAYGDQVHGVDAEVFSRLGADAILNNAIARNPALQDSETKQRLLAAAETGRQKYRSMYGDSSPPISYEIDQQTLDEANAITERMRQRILERRRLQEQETQEQQWLHQQRMSQTPDLRDNPVDISWINDPRFAYLDDIAFD